jgi:hypothetical protein
MHTVGWTTAVVGMIGFIGCGAWAMTAGILDATDEETNWELPLALTGASIGLWITGMIIAPDQFHPVSSSEARELVDKHNKKLDRELGLDPSHTPTPEASRSSFDYQFGIGAAPKGAQGVLRIQF